MSDELLGDARATLPDLNDAAEIDRSYEIFDTLLLDTTDEWGHLADFLKAVGNA